MLVLLLACLLAAQAPVGKSVETAHLVIAPSSTAAAGSSKASLVLDVTPKPRMHVYAPGQEGYIAIAVTLDAGAPVTAGKAKYPAAEKLFMAALNETQRVYVKPFRITQEVTLKSGAAAGPVTVSGKVRYQACDDKICYLPVSVPVVWTIAR